MVSYFLAEVYRLLHKKSTYIYFGILAFAYVLLTYVRSGGFDANSVVSEASMFFVFMPALVGGFLFAAIYTDDLNSKNLITLVGFGLSKVKIVITKLFLMALFCAVVFALLYVLHCAIYALLGWELTGSTLMTLGVLLLKYLLATIAFSALSGVVVYGTQRTTFSIVLFILLAFGVIGSLVSMLLNTFAPDLVTYLMSGISEQIATGILNGDSLLLPVIKYFVYVVIAVALSVVAFYRKEMEF